MSMSVLFVSSDDAVTVLFESSVDCVVDATVVSVALVLDAVVSGALVTAPATEVSIRTAVTLLELSSLPHAERPPSAVIRMVAASFLFTMSPPIRTGRIPPAHVDQTKGQVNRRPSD